MDDVWMYEPQLRALVKLLYNTPMGEFMRESRWAWPIFESLHFFGMTLLIGTVGIFDLRLMGLARRVPLPALHRMIPLGISGFALNAGTGFFFICATPDQYIFNMAFRVKATLIIIAGLNVLFFYSRVFRRLERQHPDDAPPLTARLAGAVSLTAWVGVMSAGRLITFFRPPY
jgi:uncharacterized protein DUF6644